MIRRKKWIKEKAILFSVSLTFITSILLGWGVFLSADELATRIMTMGRYYEGERPEGNRWIAKLDTESDTWGRTIKIHRDIGSFDVITTGVDGSIYVMGDASVYEGSDYQGYNATIWRMIPTITGGRVKYQECEVIYEIFQARGSSINNMARYMSKLAVRQNSLTRAHRVFFSVACGACPDVPEIGIYYVGSDGRAIPYYTIHLEEMGHPFCPKGTFWTGHFTFDDDNNLYLSSGNHVPAAIFRIRNANWSSVTDRNPPEVIWEACHTIDDMEVVGRYLYFTDGSSIYRLSLSNPERGEETVFEDSEILAIIGVDKWTREMAMESSGMFRASSRFPSRKFRTRPAPPDMAITKFLIGIPKISRSGAKITVPVRVTIKNNGGASLQNARIGFKANAPGFARVQSVKLIKPKGARQNPFRFKRLFEKEKLTLSGNVIVDLLPYKVVKNRKINLSANIYYTSTPSLSKLKLKKKLRWKEQNFKNNFRTVIINLDRSSRTKNTKRLKVIKKKE